jgi:hypothetical protein
MGGAAPVDKGRKAHDVARRRRRQVDVDHDGKRAEPGNPVDQREQLVARRNRRRAPCLVGLAIDVDNRDRDGGRMMIAQQD